MANFSYTASKSFTPFTFEQMLKPLAMYTEAINEVEEDYNNLNNEASLIKSYANTIPDSATAKRYNNFAEELERQANSLAKSGLNPSVRANLTSLKRRYADEITPIKQAYILQNKLIEEQRKLRAENPSLMFDKDFAVVAPEDIINNPNSTYIPISGNELYAKGNAAAKAASLRRISYAQRKALGDQYYELTKRQGYSSVEAANWLAGKYNIPELSAAISRINIETNTGILSKNDQIRANNYIVDGIMSGLVYSEDRSYQNNKDYITAYQQYQMGKDKKKSSIGFAPRIIEGVSGEVNKSLSILKGLRRTEDGYSTIELDSKLKALEEAKRKYDTYMSGRNEKEYLTYEASKQQTQRNARNAFGNSAYAAIASTSSNYGTPSGYGEYKKLKEKVDEAQLNYDKTKRELELLENKYNHLGNNPYERLFIASRLEDLQEKQENTSFTLNLKDSDYNNVREGVANILRSFSEKSIDSGSVGVRDIEDNEMLDYDDIQDMIKSENLGQIAIKVSGGKDNKLKLVYKGKEYEIEGVEQVTKFNKDLKTTNDFLKDFSSNITEAITPISDQTLYDIKAKGISNVSVENANLKPIKGTNFKGTTLYNRNTGELIKVMIDSSGNVVAENSLSDELLNEGANRDTYFINMANKGLRELVPLLASDAD